MNQQTHQSNHSQEQTHHHHGHAPASQHSSGHHLLQVENLSISFAMYDNAAEHYFAAKKKQFPVIHDLHVSVHQGEIVAVIGASGSGKTLLADSLMGLFEPNASVSGDIWFDGIAQDGALLKELRGQGISLVPQSINYLDPLVRVGRQVQGFADKTNRQQRKQRQAELFERYGLDSSVARLYPFELSGGMARRVLLCCALMDNPRVIIADEPTPGLDLELAMLALQDFRQFANQGGGVLLITHDIELALGVADRIAVFKEGTVVEETAVANFASPATLEHPFSKLLWHALPEHDFLVTDTALLDQASSSHTPEAQTSDGLCSGHQSQVSDSDLPVRR